ncbi:MAG: serine hydrolase domain-containing protein [Marinobacter sp.]|uniref:serine hydrolase domain-containing protein n=1 Tax=Marinobacter sp. TaxID=50741 RepID=UPI003296BBDA
MSKYFLIVLSVLLTACSDGNDSRFQAQPEIPPDFTEADAWMENFVATEEAFPGGSYVVVDREGGVLHKAAFGNLEEDSLVLLASTSKVPSVTLLMALHDDDDNVNFEIDEPIASYLPWQGVWDPAITTEHLVSNRSGIPGLANLFLRPDDYAPHLCQFLPLGTLQACAETLYTTPLPGLVSTPANTAFDYGGSQWHLSGAVAEITGGGTLNQLWDQYIGAPCGLEVTQIGNNLSLAPLWDGNAESLVGQDNANSEGGMMSSLDDYAKLLSLHLNDGLCGDNRVMSADSLAFMRIERTTAEADSWGYGMGWWLVEPDGGGPTTLFLDPGFYGSVAWLDTEREYAAVVFFEEYSGESGSVGSGAVVEQFIPIVDTALD